MTDDELDAEVVRACADSVYWDGYSHAAAVYIVRNVVLDNLDLIARLLNIDVGPEGTREDVLADIIRIMLFEPKPDRESPSSVFRRRLHNGDFQPLQIDEDPDNLPPLREPIDGTGLAAARKQAEHDSVYWAGNTWLFPNGVISSVILRS